jgi:hypothetical protein
MATIIEYPPLIAQIYPPVPPSAPTPPALPQVPAPPIADFNAMVRELLQLLQKGQRDDVLNKVERLGPSDLDALEGAIVAVFSDKNREAAYELRRIIRFIRHKPPAPGKPGTFDWEGGTTVNDARAEVKVGPRVTGKVTGQKGVTLKNFGKDAYSLTYSGPDVAEMRWLQFAWRELVRDKVPIKKRLYHGLVSYLLTTDANKPRWTTDSSASKPGPNSAFYEEDNATRRTSGELTMVDLPDSMRSTVDKFFQSTNPPTSVISHFHTATYLVRDMDILYCAEIDYTWTFTIDATRKLQVKTDSPKLKGRLEKQLTAAQRACLAVQHPELDYLPGPPIEAPQPTDEFDLVSDLAPQGWESEDIPKQYADVAALAQADLIDGVSSEPTYLINTADVSPGSTLAKPGLNFSEKLGVDGATFFIDAKNTVHNPDLPIDRNGLLPSVGIGLGNATFKVGKVRDKAFALATIRHEMTHAAHELLAIGWLLKWRDQITKTTFDDWLRGEKSRKHISEPDYSLVSSFVRLTPVDLSATEVLSWTEGLLIALRFLPPKPSFSPLENDIVWPGAVLCLREATAKYETLLSKSVADRNAVRDAVRARIRRVVCGQLTPIERDTLVDWINFVRDPDAQHPTDADKAALKVIKGSFSTSDDHYIKEILDIAKSCPK